MTISLRKKKIWKANITNRIDKRICDLRHSHLCETFQLPTELAEEKANADTALSEAVANLTCWRENLIVRISQITNQVQLDEMLALVVALTDHADNPFVDEPLPFFADE